MKITKQENQKISYSQIEKKLGVEIEKITHGEDDIFLRIYSRDGRKFVLQCVDFQELMDLDYNIFEDSVKINVKNREIEVQLNNELYRGGVAKWLKMLRR